MEATYEELQYQLSLLFNFNPPSLTPDPESTPPQLVPPPSIFYDKHLDERLTLKRVTLMPSMVTQLSETVNKMLHSFDERKIRLPSYGPMDAFPTERFRSSTASYRPIVDANSVARAYQETTASYCMSIASTMFLSPHASRWITILNWVRRTVAGPGNYRALEEDYALYFLYMPGESIHKEVSISPRTWDSLDSETRERLLQVAPKFPILAMWQIFPVSGEAEDLISDMGRFASSETFISEKCLTTGHPAARHTKLPYTPDATATLWGVPTASLTESLDVSGSPAAGSSSAPAVGTISTIGLAPVGAGNKSDSVTSKIKETDRNRRARHSAVANSSSISDASWPDVTVTDRTRSREGDPTSSFLQHVRC
jgi:hypothetical protein